MSLLLPSHSSAAQTSLAMALYSGCLLLTLLVMVQGSHRAKANHSPGRSAGDWRKQAVKKPASKNHSRKTVLVQTLSHHIILPCRCNNEGETISHCSSLCEDVAPVQKDVWLCTHQICTHIRSSELGRHISHTVPTTAAVVTAQAAQNGGQETQTCDCTAQRVSPVTENWALTHPLLNFHHPRNWTQCGRRAVHSLQLCPPTPTAANLTT